MHLVLRLKEGSSAALWKGSEIRPCNKQFISNSPVPYTKLYFTIRAAATRVLKKPPNKFDLYIQFVTVSTLISLLCLKQSDSGCSKININVILPFIATYFKWPLLFKLKDKNFICINLQVQNLDLLQVCVTWVENFDLYKNHYCHISWHFTQTQSHLYLTKVS